MKPARDPIQFCIYICGLLAGIFVGFLADDHWPTSPSGCGQCVTKHRKAQHNARRHTADGSHRPEDLESAEQLGGAAGAGIGRCIFGTRDLCRSVEKLAVLKGILKRLRSAVNSRENFRFFKILKFQKTQV